MPESGEDFDIEGLDEVIHGRLRLGVMAYLSSAESADFTTLKVKLGVTDGNLSVHVSKLDEAGYVAINKRFVGKKPQTTISITPAGRAAFAYFDKGNMATIGRSAAVAEIGKIHISGWLAWIAWLTVHLTFLVSFRSKISVLIQWMYSYFTYKRGARVITGIEGGPPAHSA